MSKLNLSLLIGAFFMVSCGDDHSSGSSTLSDGSTSFKKIVLASAVIGPGDYGLSSVDARCSAGYKALAGSTLERNTSIDWVLKPNTQYRRADGVTIIGTTNNLGVFVFPLTNSFGDSAGKYYTGIQADWTIDTTKNCDNWGSMADDRTYGDALSVTSAAIADGVHNCGTTGPVTNVVCIEQ